MCFALLHNPADAIEIQLFVIRIRLHAPADVVHAKCDRHDGRVSAEDISFQTLQAA